MSTLPISRLVKVSVTLSAKAAQAQNLTTLLILSDSDVIDSVERKRDYLSLEEVAADFSATDPEYLASVLWFEQVPQPNQLSVGRWVKSASAGKLVGGDKIQNLASWVAILDGAFDITVDGVLHHVTALDFHTTVNMNGVAAIISAATAAYATVTWNASFNRFEFKSNTTGAASTVTFLDVPAAGTNISDDLMGTALLGAYVVPGQLAETALQAATLMENQFGQKWYGLTLAAQVPPTDVDNLAVAGFIQATTTKHIFGVTETGADAITPGDTTSLAHQISLLGYDRTMTQYSSSNPFAVVSLMARSMTVDYNQNASVITLMYKQEPGIIPESLNETQIDALESKNCNVFVEYNNDTAIIEPGKMSSGEFIDVITGTHWLAIAIQNAVYNVLLTSPNKVGQSDQGMHILTTVVEAVCAQAVNNGLLNPGVWNSDGFGQLRTGDFMSKGFYVYAPPVALQDEADRGARISVPIQVAGKLAGAVHSADISVTVNK